MGSGGDFRLGEWLVQPAQCRLSKDGRTVQVRAKVMDLLAYLASRQGQVVSKDDLLNDVWGSLSVSESALTRTVTELRHALGDDADHPQLLETIAKRGYRLMGEVEYLEVASRLAPTQRAWPDDYSPLDGERQRVPRGTWFPHFTRHMPAFLAVGLVFSVLVARPWRPQESPVRIGTLAVPLAMFRGLETDPDLSADGSQVVFAHSPDTAVWDFDLQLKAVGQGTTLRLTADPLTSDLSPVWSPDGRRIAFLRRRSGEPEQLIVMPALGGSARHVASLQTGVAHLGDGLLSWTPDGRSLVVGAAVEDRRGIWLFEVDGEGRTLLIRTPANAHDRSPVVSADGRHLAFIRQRSAYGGALCMLPLSAHYEAAGPVATVLAPSPLQVVGVAWTPDDEALVYALGGHHAPTRLYRAHLAADRLSLAGDPEVLRVGENALGVDISPSGHMAYAVVQRDTRFWRLDLKDSSNGVRDAELFESTLDEATPQYSPDGSRIAFASTRSGTQEIWVGGADGTDARQMTQMGGALCMDPRWSPDGRRVLFTSDRTGSGDLYDLDPASGQVRRLTSADAAERAGRWSRDGKWIYFSSSETGRWEIWKMAAGGGPAVQITRMGGSMAEESQDGHALFVVRGAGIWRVPLDGSEPVMMAEGLAAENVAVGRDAIYYLAGPSHGRRTLEERQRTTRDALDDVAVIRLDLATGRKERRAGYRGGFWYGLALSPDGGTLLGVAASGGMDLMIVEPS